MSSTFSGNNLDQPDLPRPHDSLTVSRESTSISPELVLVDPGLGAWARKRLPAPPDTLEAVTVARTRPTSAEATGAPDRRRWRDRVVTGTGVLVILAGTAFVVGSRADVREPPAASLTAIAEPRPPARTTRASEPVKKPVARKPSPRRSAGVASTRRFAWSPVAGATGYHVELFKGSMLVFREQTKKPEILIRRRWRFNRRLRALDPGAYRWYVWPLVDGQRQVKAIVRAKLVVPR